MCSKHRNRMRHLWDPKSRPAPSSGGAEGGDEALSKAGAAAVKSLNAKAARARGTTSAVDRLRHAEKLAEFTKGLGAALASWGGADTAEAPAAGPELRQAWAGAANPARRTLTPSMRDPKELTTLLKEPLPVRVLGEVSDKMDAEGTGEGTGDGPIGGAGALDSNGRYAEISEDEFDSARAAWLLAKQRAKEANVAFDEKPPLNPQQRLVIRRVLRAVGIRQNGRRRGRSALEIMAELEAADLSPATLLIGAGGTGKSAVMHEIEVTLRAIPSWMLVTAFTGVAAAPFGSPTLLSLFKFGVGVKDREKIAKLNQQQLSQTREKFLEESGMRIEDVDVLVIDEVSFINHRIIGHLEATCRQLLDPNVPWGGLIVIFAGDNKQKSPPGAKPWYKTLVAAATDSKASKDELDTAACRGHAVLRAMPLVELTRIMRAADDPLFVAAQQEMRKTDKTQPVSNRFRESLKALSRQDLQEDPSWRFAAIGVQSQHERDYLNMEQARAFAQAFGLVLVRWKLPINNIEMMGLTPEEEEALYRDEPAKLWGYWVEGAPAHLTNTIKSVRKLVNGSSVLLDGLQFENDVVPAALSKALARGTYSEVVLAKPPLAINVKVSGGLWHGVELPDLSGLIESDSESALIVPILESGAWEEVSLGGFAAAQHDAMHLQVKQHGVMLGFALTDFKLQGRTLPRLLLSIPDTTLPPFLRMDGFYVLVSRVTSSNGLRLLQYSKKGLDRLKKLYWPGELGAWEQGYEDGRWSDVRAAEALGTIAAAKRSAPKKAKEGGAKAKEGGANRKTKRQGLPSSPTKPPKRQDSLSSPTKPPRSSTGAMARLAAAQRNEQREQMNASFAKHAMVEFSLEQARRELAGQAALLQVDPTQWARVLELWATTHSRNILDQVPGYHTTSMMSRKDFRSLLDGDMLRDEVMTQAGIRITATAQHAIFYTSFALELVAPFQNGGDGSPNGRKLSRK